MDLLSILDSLLDIEKKKLDLKKKKCFHLSSRSPSTSPIVRTGKVLQTAGKVIFFSSPPSPDRGSQSKEILGGKKNRKLHRGLLRGRQRLTTVNCAPSLIAFIWHSQNWHWVLGKAELQNIGQKFCFPKPTIEHRRWFFFLSGIHRINIVLLSAWLACKIWIKSLDFDKLSILRRIWLVQSGTFS